MWGTEGLAVLFLSEISVNLASPEEGSPEACQVGSPFGVSGLLPCPAGYLNCEKLLTGF